MYRIHFSAVALVAAAALTAVACSESPTRLSQTGPSALSTASTGASDPNGTSSVIDRTTGVVRDGGTVGTWARQRGWAMAEGLMVEGTDVITAVTGTCPDAVITVRGVPVTVNAATTFGTGITCETLAVDLDVKVTGLLTFAEGMFAVVATKIEPPPSTTPVVVEVTGVVASFSGVCPSLTVTLQGTGGVVLTDSTTVFAPEASCSQIASGRTIEAKGTRNTSGHLVATDVKVQAAPVPTHGRKLSGEGTIELVTGTCPDVTVTVRGVAVTTSEATVYVGGTCADLRESTKVSIDAETQLDESLLATTVRILEKPGQGGHRVAGEGTVNHVTGTCPTVSLNVQGYTVNISSETIFTGGACSSLRNGVKIAATGVLVGTTLTAEAVTIKSTGRR